MEAADATTDAAGRARLAALPAGDLWLLVDAPGFARRSAHLFGEPRPELVSIELPAAHSIRVAVRDDLEAPVQNAQIEVASGDDPLPVGARTAADGSASVDHLAQGPWRVTVHAEGFEEGTARAERDEEVVALTLRKLGAIHVHVERPSPDDSALPRVSIAGAALWPVRSAKTNAAGDVRIGGLAAGTYALRATQGDWVSPIEFGVDLARGEEKSVTLRLGSGHFVSVRVTDGDADDADAIQGARVTLAEGGLSPFPLEATTDAKGRARLGPIAAGTATLVARAEGFVPRGWVSLPDPPPPETRVVLVRAGVVSGRVVDSRGYPVGGASIEITGTEPSGAPIFDDPRRSDFQSAHFDAMLAGPAPLVTAGELGVVPGPVPAIPRASIPGEPHPASHALESGRALGEPWVTKADGTFRAAPATPGRVRVIARHPQYVDAQSEMVALMPGGEAEVDLVMHAGGVLQGRLMDANEQPVAGGRIFVSAAHGTVEKTTRTANDGTFQLAALPDLVTVTATADEEGSPQIRTSVAIAEGGRKDITLTLPPAGQPLTLIVVDERDYPVDAAQLSVSSLSATSPFRQTAFTDPHGEALLKHGRGLPLRIEARAPSHAPRIVNYDGIGESVRVVLAAPESATGVVQELRGRDPIAGAEITLSTALGTRHARSDSAGAFTFAELEPGTARLRVRAPGFATDARAIVIPESEGRRPYEIPIVELSPEGVIKGEVVDGRGQPVSGARVAKDHVPTWLVVGSNPEGVAVTDAKGRFSLNELPEGLATVEAFAPDLGRARSAPVTVTSGRVTDRVRIAFGPNAAGDHGSRAESSASGGVAVTLGEAGTPPEVVIVSVVERSEAERAGLAPGDVLKEVDGAAVTTMEDARARLSGPLADDVLVRVRRGTDTFLLRVGRDSVRR
jgi:hypothetical protein